ncbi:GlsB/YeaQ/YmgE family stress response membrane protein [Rhodobacteraceae bacterium CCMM004]|nr:GlsB/YeaQ/YmgE family stress response membrane protein [Rhodobacteraceae bacterium CCMM004]
MEGLFEALGAVSLALLAIVGLAAGLIAGAVAGRNKLLYAVAGVAGAVALPFLLAALGVTMIAAGGILILLVFALVGAGAILFLIGLLTRNKG